MGIPKRILLRANWIANQLGIYPSQLMTGFGSIPRYFSERRRFVHSLRQTGSTVRVTMLPALHDLHAQAGELGEYFWQDLAVARMVMAANAKRHLDVGSRIDGFVGHVSVVREIEIIDIRPITDQIPNVVFRQADMMGTLPPELVGCCDSLSCLHAIEHFGLGRYGDPIDASGLVTGIRNLATMLSAGGILYLSTPIGIERVEFNAHRISDPRSIRRIAGDAGLELKQFLSVEANKLIEHQAMDDALLRLSLLNYSLGIFVFERRSA